MNSTKQYGPRKTKALEALMAIHTRVLHRYDMPDATDADHIATTAATAILEDLYEQVDAEEVPVPPATYSFPHGGGFPLKKVQVWLYEAKEYLGDNGGRY
jgi:hypothetical protein